MLMRAPARQKPRRATVKAFLAPVGGWVANRNLAQPNGQGMAQGAEVLDNFFPTSSTAVLRRGKELYATLGAGDLPTTALFSYVVGNQQQLFGATESAIYDITTISSARNYQIATEDDDLIVTENDDTIGENSTLDQFEVYENLTGGEWSVVQFATTGGIFLVGVNGSDLGFIYDGGGFYPIVEGGVSTISYDAGTVDFTAGETVTGGTSGATATILEVLPSGTAGEGALLLIDVTGLFEDNETLTDGLGGSATAASLDTVVVPGITFEGTTDLDTSDLSYVWTYKNRLFFVQKDSLDVWYLPVDQIGGELSKFPLGGIFGRGGSLMFGATWSLDSGSSGGLSEQCVFITTEGEVGVYQGDDPSSASGWSKVGVYRIGRPLGDDAWIRAGADLLISTSIGLEPLSRSISRSEAALASSAVSYPIEDAWNEAVALRGLSGWKCEIWPEQQLVAVSPPTTGESQPVMFVANAVTGAWTRYTNWDARCMVVFQGQLFFGSPNGEVYRANVSGLDDGDAYTGSYIPLFDDMGSPASLKVGQLARAVIRARGEVNELLSLQTDFNTDLPAAPDAALSGTGNEWGTAIWGESTWGAVSPTVINQRWQSIGGAGYALSVGLQVTSGAIPPLDAEIVRIEMTMQTSEVVT